ncbi:MAG TPA: hypothetical protein PLD63_14530 [Ignavibacteria bacterium]|nr:hypothetical protein [Ignavibacteria bacterium]
MKDHSLIKLLRTFSGEEIKEFGEFISNSYYNKRKAVKKLYDIIRKQYPDFNEKNIDKKNIYQLIFPDKKYSESSFSVIIHYLHDLAKRFITLKKFEENTFEYNFNLESELFDRKQTGNPGKILEKYLKELDPSNYLSDDYYKHKYRLKFEAMFYLIESNYGVYEKFLDKLDFQGMYKDFHYHYLIKSMRLYLNLLNTEKIYNRIYDKDRFGKMMENIESEIGNFEDAPIVKIYYYLIRMLIEESNDEFYFKVKEILNGISYKINIDDLAEIYINMQNFCKRKLSEGKQNFLREEFDILSKQLEAKTYLVNGNMHSIFYRNAVNIALKLKEHEWVKNFISIFKEDLQKEYRESNFLYCSAQYEFYVKNYDTSLEMLSKLKLDEVYLKYEVKILQMMIYFETDSHENLFSLLETYRHFLKNNEMLPGKKKKLYLNFYKYLNKLVNIKKKKDRSELREIKKMLESEAIVNNKDWLMKKIDEDMRETQYSKKLRRA